MIRRGTAASPAPGIASVDGDVRRGSGKSSPACRPRRRAGGRTLAGRFATGAAWLVLILAWARGADLSTRTLLLDAALAGDAIVAVGERGTILRSADNGVTWTAIASRTPATLTGVNFAGPQHGWAVGHDAIVLASADGGLSWSKQWQGGNLSDSFLDVLALDESHAIAVGAYGLYVTTADGGRTWTARKILPEDYHLNRISRGPTGTLYLAGEHGTVLRSTDHGGTWTGIPTAYDGSFYGVLPLDGHTLLAHGLRGRVFRSSDDGRAWEAVETRETALLAAAALLRDGTIALAGSARALLVSRDGGRTFARRDVGVPTGIAELLPLPGDQLLILGEAGVTRVPAGTVAQPARPPGSRQP